MSPQVTDGPLVALRALEDVLQRSCADEFLKTAVGDDCLFDLLLRTLQNVHNDCLDELLGSVASDMEKKIGLLHSQLESDTIKDFIEKVDARLEEADLSVLFAAAVSEAGKNAYKHFKYIDTHRKVVEDMAQMSKSIDLQARMKRLDLVQSHAKSVAAKLTVVQAMARPLKLGEKRAAIALRLKTVLDSETKQMWTNLPAHITTFVEQAIGAS